MNERLTALVGARISEFKKKMNEVKTIASSFSKDDATKDVNANTRSFMASLNLAKARVSSFTSIDAEKKIDGDISGLTRSIVAAKAQLATLGNRTVVGITVSRDRFRKSMDKVAGVYRDVATIGGEMFQGGIMTSVPVMTTMMSGLIAVVATAGVQIGVMAGGLMGLASSASMAGAGFGLFAAAAIPTINRIKEANEAIQNGDRALSSYSGPMQTAITGLNNLKESYDQVNQAIQPQVLRMSGSAMGVLSGVLTRIQPGIVAVAGAFEGLISDLKGVMRNGEDVKKTMEWFNERAGAAVSAWGKIAGYALRGFFNLLRAFDPLAQSMEQGLLGMTKRFSEWAAGLSKSEKFNKFIEYVKENGPKLMSVFGNITQGIVNLFTAFAPLAADMMTGFQKLTERFKEWSASLGENQEFQNFVQYVRDNGPGMIELIGNMWNIFKQLAKGLGTVGAAMLPVVNNFTSWFGSLLEGNPMVRNMMGAAVALGGAIKLLAPIVSGLFAVFGPAIKGMWAVFAPFRKNMMIGLKMLGPQLLGFAKTVGSMALKVGGAFVKIVPKLAMFATKLGGMVTKAIGFLVKLGGRAVIWAARMAAQWLIAMGPVGWVIGIIAALVVAVIMNWDKVKKWTKQAWTAVSEWVKQKWQEIWSKTKEVASNIVTSVREKFQQAKQAVQDKLQSAKQTASNIWQSIKTRTSNLVQNIKTTISDKFEQAKQAVQNKLQAAKDKAISIWENIKSRTSNLVQNIKDTVSEKFQAMKDAVSEKIQSAKDTITETWDSVMEFFRGIDLFEIGGNIIQGLIDGIKSIDLGAVISGLADKVPGWIKKPLGIASPSKVTTKLGEYTTQGLAVGMEGMERKLKRTAQSVADAAVPNVQTPAISGVNAPRVSAGNMDATVRHEVDRSRDDEPRQPFVIQSVIDGREVARSTHRDVNEFIKRDEQRRR